MAADVSEIRVFIASPGDLEDERAALRELESALNVTFAPAGIRVRFTGWEEVPPGYGRPQARINPLVDECDIFIGMLRRKWGTATGEHESGFIEEFERAVKRRMAGGSEPEIALYFAKMAQGELDDAGPDLTKVLEFKKRIEAERIALYSTFNSSDDLAGKVATLLNIHFVKRMVDQGTQSTPEGAASGVAAIKPDVAQQVEEATTAGDELDAAGLQIIATLNSLRDLLHGRAPEVPLDRDRLDLLGTALGRDEEPIGTHLVNRLYRRRRELELIPGEHSCWFRTLLDDIGQRDESAYRVVPGWGLVDPQDPDFPNVLVRFAKVDDNAGRGAIRTLQRLRLRPRALWPRELSPGNTTGGDNVEPDQAKRTEAWVEILNSHVRRGAALDYLLQDIDSSDQGIVTATDALLAHLLDKSELNENSRNLIDGARQALQGNPEALADALGYSADDNAQWRLVQRQVEKLSPKLTNQLAEQKYNRGAQLAAINAGLASGTLTDNTLTDLLLLDDDEIADLLVDSVAGDTDRAMHFVTLIRNNTKTKLTPDETEARLLAAATPPQVLEQLQATSDYSVLHWEALTYATPTELEEDAREVLRTNAADLRARLDPKISDEHKKALDYLAGDQRRAAANLLSRQQTPSENDIDLLLTWFSQEAASGLLRSYVWKVLVRIANETTITKITDAMRPHVEVLGFHQAIEHLDGPLAPAIAAVLIDRDAGDTLREQARRWHIQQPERTEAELREALYSEDATVRITAAKALVARLDHEELSKLQNEYPDVEGRFWYNVIALFDEHIYAPTPRD